MCTSVTYTTEDTYFGRNLDLEFSYKEEVVVTPRNYPFSYRHTEDQPIHHAIIGMAYVVNNYPLYYDAINEKGLGIAGLNFVGNAYYFKELNDKKNVAQFEFIPFVLSQCADVSEARELIENTNITDDSYSEELPFSQLHWIISDDKESIVVEQTRSGMNIYDNPVRVLTNNPEFPIQMNQLNNYINLTAEQPYNRFSHNVRLETYSRGMGAIGLPGDLSSQSRFVRAAFTLHNSAAENDEKHSVSQFFHILHSVEQQRGCCNLGDHQYEMTIYSSCCNLKKGIYYYTTYDNHQITGVDMHKTDLDSTELARFPLILDEQIVMQN